MRTESLHDSQLNLQGVPEYSAAKRHHFCSMLLPAQHDGAASPNRPFLNQLDRCDIFYNANQRQNSKKRRKENADKMFCMEFLKVILF
ncbi:hypothetical protein F2P81_004235 [Scophthalmus maximus]|uniref:Uncharacterized protein n=1 Tax=Scophthalmus maximus TaxID=52904 RepID=A0A6A4TEP7_SCOMX|nr:hypothetical protein F2P81_004235 [Scophthalmus maximus]